MFSEVKLEIEKPAEKHISHENYETNMPEICNEFCFLCEKAVKPMYLTNDIYVIENFIYISNTPNRISGAAFRMLCAFGEFKGKTLSREFLLKYTWNGRHKVANNVNVVVSELRMILTKTDINIITVRGVGYRMITRSHGT